MQCSQTDGCNIWLLTYTEKINAQIHLGGQDNKIKDNKTQKSIILLPFQQFLCLFLFSLDKTNVTYNV